MNRPFKRLDSKGVAFVVVFAEGPKILLPVAVWNLTVFINFFLSGGWFPNCLKDAKVYLLH